MAIPPRPSGARAATVASPSRFGRRAALASSAYLFLRLKREEAARAALAAEVAALGPRFEQFKGAVRDVEPPADVQCFHQVDLATRGLEPIAGGFYIIDISANSAGKGTRIVGKIAT